MINWKCLLGLHGPEEMTLYIAKNGKCSYYIRCNRCKSLKSFGQLEYTDLYSDDLDWELDIKWKQVKRTFTKEYTGVEEDMG